MNFPVLAILALWGGQAFACYWQPYEPPFWPSTNIQVCFDPPTANLQGAAKAAFDASMRNIQTAFTSQISQRTPFKLSGFQLCQSHRNPDGSARHDLPHAVRIKLTENTTRGASGKNAGAAEHGPNSGKSSTNIEVDYIVGGTPPPPLWQADTALHEFLHLLGIQHEERRMENAVNTGKSAVGAKSNAGPPSARASKGQAVVENLPPRIAKGAFDASSIMSNSRPEANAVLSAGDIECVQSIANHSILRGSGSAAGAGSSPGAIDSVR